MKYKVYLSTENSNQTPQLNDVNISFYSVCVPPSQVLFQNLTAADYDLEASAGGYITTTSTVMVSNGWQETEIFLYPI